MLRVLSFSLAAFALLRAGGCERAEYLAALREERVQPAISVSDDTLSSQLSDRDSARTSIRLTGPGGEELTLMKTSIDEDGNAVASDRIDASVVFASFRNVAERNGEVDLRFDISIPYTMIQPGWQLRLRPHLVLGPSTDSLLESVLLTGEEYRRRQMRGYEKYGRFLESIITDRSMLLRSREMEVFLSRLEENLPSDLVEEHYRDRVKSLLNEFRLDSRERLYSRWIKVPLSGSGVRLDSTVASFASGAFRYEYSCPLFVDEATRKAGIYLEGDVYSSDRKLCTFRAADTLDYYISSLTSLVRGAGVPSADSLYMKGVECLKNRKYKEAYSILRDYSDFNSALASVALDYRATALDILSGLSEDAGTMYLKSIIYSRSGEDSLSLVHYLNACREDNSFIHRGNLDPEISELIKTYQINTYEIL